MNSTGEKPHEIAAVLDAGPTGNTSVSCSTSRTTSRAAAIRSRPCGRTASGSTSCTSKTSGTSSPAPGRGRAPPTSSWSWGRRTRRHARACLPALRDIGFDKWAIVRARSRAGAWPHAEKNRRRSTKCIFREHGFHHVTAMVPITYHPGFFRVPRGSRSRSVSPVVIAVSLQAWRVSSFRHEQVQHQQRDEIRCPRDDEHRHVAAGRLQDVAGQLSRSSLPPTAPANPPRPTTDPTAWRGNMSDVSVKQIRRPALMR